MYIPRPRFEFTALHAAVLLAMLIHGVMLFAYATLFASQGKDFFADREVKLVETVVTLTTVKPTPAPPPPVVEQPRPPVAVAKPAATPPPVHIAKPKPNPAPIKRGGEHPGPKQFATKRAPVTDVAPPVVAARNGPGPAMAVGNGTGPKGGDPNSHGNGDGSKNQGDPNGVKDGDPNGGGGPKGVQTVSWPDYNNYDHMPTEIRPNDPREQVKANAASSRSWKDLCGYYGIDYGKLSSLPHVEPYCLGQDNPPLAQQNELNGKEGSVHIIVDIDEKGIPTAQIVKTDVDIINRVGYYIASHTHWLPALAYGKPVPAHLEYNLWFRTVSGEPPPPGQPPPGGPSAPAGASAPGGHV
jgi:hypothetical protein